MKIDTSDLIRFLTEFSALGPAEQRVFLFCLQFCPHPALWSSDLMQIRSATGVSRKTLYNAFQDFGKSAILKRAVYCCKKPKEAYYAEQQREESSITAED